jgi:hypothetical protein
LGLGDIARLLEAAHLNLFYLFSGDDIAAEISVYDNSLLTGKKAEMESFVPIAAC